MIGNAEYLEFRQLGTFSVPPAYSGGYFIRLYCVSYSRAEKSMFFKCSISSSLLTRSIGRLSAYSTALREKVEEIIITPLDTFSFFIFSCSERMVDSPRDSGTRRNHISLGSFLALRQRVSLSTAIIWQPF